MADGLGFLMRPQLMERSEHKLHGRINPIVILTLADGLGFLMRPQLMERSEHKLHGRINPAKLL